MNLMNLMDLVASSAAPNCLLLQLLLPISLSCCLLNRWLVGWLVGWMVRRLDSCAKLLNPTLHDPMNSGFNHGYVILGYCLLFAIHADLQLLLLLLLGPGASKNSDACNYKITATLLASIHQK